jgi:hypothetical protein
VEIDCTGDFSWEKTIEKSILRVLGSSEFSHRLDPTETLAVPNGNTLDAGFGYQGTRFSR